MTNIRKLEQAVSELATQLQEAERDLAEAQGELELTKRYFAYVVDTPEAQRAIAAAEAKVAGVEERVQELRAAHREAVEQLEEARRKERERRSRAVAKARKRLPQLAREFHGARCALLQALPEVLAKVTEAIRPVEEAVDRYCRNGEAFREALKTAQEFAEGISGWPFSWGDLSDPARVLWRRVLEENPIPQTELSEEELELLEWFRELLATVERFRSDFPPIFRTLAEEKQLKAEARRRLERLVGGGR